MGALRHAFLPTAPDRSRHSGRAPRGASLAFRRGTREFPKAAQRLCASAWPRGKSAWPRRGCRGWHARCAVFRFNRRPAPFDACWTRLGNRPSIAPLAVRTAFRGGVITNVTAPAQMAYHAGWHARPHTTRSQAARRRATPRGAPRAAFRPGRCWNTGAVRGDSNSLVNMTKPANCTEVPPHQGKLAGICCKASLKTQ